MSKDLTINGNLRLQSYKDTENGKLNLVVEKS